MNRLPIWLFAMLVGAGAGHAAAHDFDLGSLRVDHPYALPANAGEDARIYFRTLKNFGRVSGEIVAASSPSCGEVRVVGPGGDGTPLPIPGRAATRYRHDQPVHLRCVGARQTLADGDEFPLTLDLGAAGRVDISVFVQQPRLSW